jgi:Ca2+-binding RTX toxin-like protein
MKIRASCSSQCRLPALRRLDRQVIHVSRAAGHDGPRTGVGEVDTALGVEDEIVWRKQRDARRQCQTDALLISGERHMSDDTTIGNASGTYDITAGDDSFITVGNGNDTIDVSGGNDALIRIGNGNDTITATQ